MLFADYISVIRELRVELFHIRRKIRNGQRAVEAVGLVAGHLANLIGAGDQLLLEVTFRYCFKLLQSRSHIRFADIFSSAALLGAAGAV